MPRSVRSTAIFCLMLGAVVVLAAWAAGTTFATVEADLLADHLDGSNVPIQVESALPSSTATNTPVCGLAWRGVEHPGTAVDARLNGIAAVSPSDIWAVGATHSGTAPFAEHWDGTTWTAIAVQPVPGDYAQFSDVVALASNDVWAVGHAGWQAGGNRSETLVQHWDGTTWTRVPSPNTADRHNSFKAVAAHTPNDIWAVGYAINASEGYFRTLIQHWDGNSWSVVPSPMVGTYDNLLNDVTTIDADDAWAVGYYRNDQGPYRTLLLHWDGSAWTAMPGVDPDPLLNYLYTVEAVASDDVWAAGQTYQRRSLIIHWNGTSWNEVDNPGNFNIDGLYARNPQDIWAVGGGENALHWNGTEWSLVRTIGAVLEEVIAFAPDQAWAVGTVLERYSDPCAVATDTPVPTDTPTGTYTATHSSTSTSTRTVQPSPTRTGITQCHTYVTEATASCSIPETYTYHFHLTNICANGYIATVQLQAAPDIGGPWTVITQREIGRSYVPDIDGTFPVTIPQQYNWYRIRLTGESGIWPFEATTEPDRICSRPPLCPPSWNERAPYPIPISSHALTALGNNLYSFGGLSNNTMQTAAYKYDASANAWSAVAPFPGARYNATVSVSGLYVYVINGMTNSGETSTAFRYDPVTNSYSAIPNGILPTSQHAAVFLNGALYRIGGSTPGGPLPVRGTDTVEIYGLHYVAPLPEPLVAHMAVGLNGYIYVAGGLNVQGGSSTKTYRYDPIADVWSDSAVADLSVAFQNSASGVLDGKWIIAGGGIGDNRSAIAWDPATDTWSSLTPLPVGRYRPAGATIGDDFYLVGGSTGSGDTASTLQVSFEGCTTASPTPISTSTRTSTATRTSQPNPTPTACILTFTDVPVDNTFYPFVRCLACRGIVTGYPCGGVGEPCGPGDGPYFRPYDPVTRGQAAKIVSESAGFTEPIPPSQWTFTDVPYGSAFWLWVERLSRRGVMAGYTCGGMGEPCDSQNRPYFRPNAGATRGQLAKIVSEAAGFATAIPPTQYTFADVEPGSTFWLYIERLLLNRPGVMAGYPCGGPGEPCDSDNRPYFRSDNSVTRGQTSKIVANTFFPGCSPPLR